MSPGDHAAAGPPGPDDLVEASIAAGVRDPRVLDALRAVPRTGFVPPDLVAQAYLDRPLPIPQIR